MPQCPACGASYSSTVRICPNDGTVLTSEPARDPRVGTLLAGKYQIEAAVGRGGMGTIYRATHVMLGKSVAVKVINPELDITADIVTRFQREARAASQLDHPNIATVHDLGQLDDGTLYIAMELVDGETLKSVIARDGRLDPSRIVRLLTQVASALEAAHAAGIIHRDLKPQNIMITAGPDGAEVAKLLDFGIAKTLDDSATQLTSTGLSLGTPQYMAPEQASGSAVDARTDIYSLGVILYEMLTGEVPFDDPSTPAVLVKHITELPVRPSERCPGVELPPDLEAIALRCLQKDPAARFQTAAELRRALDAAGSAKQVSGGRGRARSLPGAMEAEAPAPGDLERDDPTLPPRSALQNLTSVGSSGLHVPVAASTGSESSPRGNAVLLVVMVIALLGGVGLVAYGLGYFSRAAEVAEPSEALMAAPVQPAARAANVPASGTPETAATGREVSQPSVVTAAGASAIASVPETNRARSETPQVAVPPDAPVPQQPTPVEPPRPDHPSVRFGCDGPTDVCAAIQSALDRELERASMPSVSDETAAEILVDALVAEGTPVVQESFGTTFIVQPYTVSLGGTARRANERVPMPDPRSFSLDQRVGRARLAEQARLIAAAVVERVRAYWNR